MWDWKYQEPFSIFKQIISKGNLCLCKLFFFSLLIINENWSHKIYNLQMILLYGKSVFFYHCSVDLFQQGIYAFVRLFFFKTSSKRTIPLNTLWLQMIFLYGKSISFSYYVCSSVYCHMESIPLSGFFFTSNFMKRTISRSMWLWIILLDGNFFNTDNSTLYFHKESIFIIFFFYF